ncbi:viral A-type inclusion protein [Angomonas deanei]|uniref:Uncharacterized protein n=1 Tax=Angomonas deanei TaxID=59799 RepID=A0A7G2C616_9TRYP|nr:viral A-type inclusion protein [Angomonas deanei]CAD2214945.1 hypothetical protein, conserved [Angomonas deanei]|eukprot:EPY24345.1 viral A-type inclusion protein [Angomonas deanei]
MLSEKQLKEQLSEKELRIYELELEVKDLKTEVGTLYNVKDKLELANRNARVLEEENIELHSLVKGKNFTSSRNEATKLIKENEELRRALEEREEELKGNLSKIRADSNSQEKALREAFSEKEKISMESERMAKELDNSRRQCLEIKQILDDERETVKHERELWSQEKSRFEQKINELLDGRFEAGAKKDARSKVSTNTVQYSLHKEEVDFLENKVKEIQQKLWVKEKEWSQRENELKLQIAQLSTSGNVRNTDKNVIFGLQAQIAALQDEIKNIRDQSKSQQTPALNDDVESVVSYKPAYGKPTSRSTSNLPSEYEALLKENEELRTRLDKYTKDNEILQSQVDDGNLTIEELEYALTVTRANDANKGNSAAPLRNNAAEDAERKAKKLENKLNDLRSAKEQQQLLNDVRQKEYQKQIENLLAENNDFRALSNSNLGSDSIARLLKDKRDCVEDVMRLLEAAWQGEEEARSLLRKAQYQLAQLAEANALKDEEIRNLQKALENMEDRLRNMFGENEKLRKELEEKDDLLDDLENKLRDLQAKLNDLEKENEGLRADVKRKEKENANLKSLVDDLERQIDANGKGRDDEIGALEDLLNDLRNENNRLRQQLASANSPQRFASSPKRITDSQTSDRRRSAVPEGAHLSVTIVELLDVMRNGLPITEPGYIIVKLKSIKEK